MPIQHLTSPHPKWLLVYPILHISIYKVMSIGVSLTGSTKKYAIYVTQRRAKIVIVANMMDQNKVRNQSMYVSASNILNMYPYYDSSIHMPQDNHISVQSKPNRIWIYYMLYAIC